MCCHRLINLEEMFQFPFEVFLLYGMIVCSIYMYIHLYMSAHYYFIIII